MSAVAKRYARAAVRAAEEKGGTEAILALAEGLEAVRAALAASPELHEVLHNPALEEQRGAVLAAVLRKLGTAEHAARLVQLLAERHRIDILADVVLETQAIADERVGRLRARVVSAMPLREPALTRLTRALEKRFGLPVLVDLHVDPSLLGGLVCQVGDLTLDNSVKRQLESLKERLLA